MFRRNLVRVPKDLEAVTTRAPEAPPAEVGLAHDAPERIWQAAEGLYRTGVHPAMTLCIRRRGQVVLNRAIGHARGAGPGESGPKVLATPETPYCLFSASKAVTAMVIHLLDDRGLLHVDDRVVEYLPEFGAHGKDATTIRHVLTHRAGIPSVVGHDDKLGLLHDFDGFVDHLCRTKPVSIPGRTLAYHAITGGFILGAIVERVTGKTLQTVLREEVSEPLGMEVFGFGLRPEHRDGCAVNAFTGPSVPFPLTKVAERALGIPYEEVIGVSNQPEWMDVVIPAGNLYATADEASRFYQLLLDGGELHGKRVFERRTVRRAVVESSYLEMDLMLMVPVRYGLGLMLGAKRVSPFGANTAQAFGHLGFIQMLTWADPARDLSVALLNSGKPFFGAHIAKLVKLVSTIAEQCPAS